MDNKSIIWLIVVLFILLIGAGIFGYIYYNKYQKKNEDFNTSQLIIIQNEKYHKEILEQKEDSIQVLSGLVKDLNLEKSGDKKVFLTQITDLKLQIESLKDSGKAVSITGIDDSGAYLDIPFQGRQSIVFYSGFTRHYYNLNKDHWWVNIVFDSINVRSIFYLDIDNIWKLSTISNTPGIKLRTDYAIDPVFYSYFGGLEVDKAIVKESFVILRLKAGIAGSWHSNDFYRKYPVDLSAEIYYDVFYGVYHPLQNYISLGFYYDINLSKSFKIVKDIFSKF